MKLLSIHIQNLRLHADTHIEFPEGVVGIIGTNGSGKSTVLEAIIWCLYGGDTTRGTKEDLRWYGAPARHVAKATLRFEVGGTTYRLERTESGAKLYDEAGSAPLAEGTAAVNEHVPTIVGMNHGEFRASYLCAQKDLTRIASMGGTERQAFIRQVMGIGKIDHALKKCRAKKSELSQERVGLEVGLGERGPLDQAVTVAEVASEHAQSEVIVQAERARKAEEAAGLAADALSASNTRKEEHDAAVRKDERAKTSQEAATLEVTRLEARTKLQEEATTRLAEKEPEVARLPAFRKERDGLTAARASISERKTLQERREALGSEIDTLHERIADAQAQVGLHDRDAHLAAERAAKAADARLDRLNAERLGLRWEKMAASEAAGKEAKTHERRIEAITGAGENGDCPTCLRRLGDTFAAVVDLLTGELRKAREVEVAMLAEWEALGVEPDDEKAAAVARDAAEKEVERFLELKNDAALGAQQVATEKPRLQDTEAELQRVTTRLASLPSVTFDPERLQQVEAEIARLEQLDRELAGDRGLVAQVQDTAEELERRRTMLAAAESERAEAVATLDKLAFKVPEHEERVSRDAVARNHLSEVRVAAGRAEEAAKGAAETLRAATRAVEDYDRRGVRLAEVSHLHHVHEKSAARLGDFRVSMAATIRPEMEELMSGFVHLLTDGRHEAVTLTDDFSCVLHESGVPTPVVSGGTEDVAALAMRLAISQMIAERAGHPLSLMILDEPFGSLDETRRGNVLALIRRLKGVFPQVLVISHVAETRDAVDHVIELEFSEAERCSRVVSQPALATEAA